MNKLIIIDGTYGVGKTTVAHCICEISNEKYICIDPDGKFNNDPKRYLLSGWPIQSNIVMLGEIRKEIEEKIQKNNIVIPLTLNSSKYKQMWVNSLQDLAELHHIILIAERNQILSRISTDDQRDMSLAMESLDGNLKYYQGNIEGSIKIETSDVTPKIVANKILDVV